MTNFVLIFSIILFASSLIPTYLQKRKLEQRFKLASHDSLRKPSKVSLYIFLGIILIQLLIDYFFVLTSNQFFIVTFLSALSYLALFEYNNLSRLIQKSFPRTYIKASFSASAIRLIALTHYFVSTFFIIIK